MSKEETMSHAIRMAMGVRSNQLKSANLGIRAVRAGLPAVNPKPFKRAASCQNERDHKPTSGQPTIPK
jgi:hypothetical protein